MAKLTPIDTECHHGLHSLAEYPLNGTLPDVKCRPTVHIFMTPTAIHVHPVHSINAKALMATKLGCQYHGSILLQIQFLYSLFLQYTKLLNPFYFVAFIPQE